MVFPFPVVIRKIILVQFSFVDRKKNKKFKSQYRFTLILYIHCLIYNEIIKIFVFVFPTLPVYLVFSLEIFSKNLNGFLCITVLIFFVLSVLYTECYVVLYLYIIDLFTLLEICLTID